MIAKIIQLNRQHDLSFLTDEELGLRILTGDFLLPNHFAIPQVLFEAHFGMSLKHLLSVFREAKH